MRRVFWVIVACTTVAAVSAQADPPRVALDGQALQRAFDAALPTIMSDGKIPGAVVHVGVRNGDHYDTWQKAYGYKQLQPDPAPMTEDAIFDLASMTKPIATGTSLMILVDRGQVRLDDPVGKFLEEFNRDDKKNVTVRHLMTHMSGLKPYVHAGEQKKIKDRAGFPCRDALRTYIRELDLTHPPGEMVVYSCLNAILTAEIVRTVSGQELDQFAADNIFKPLGMTETGFNPLEALRARALPTTRTDYGKGDGGFLQGQVHDPLAAMQGGVSGNAGLFSSVRDLARFAQMMLNGGELDGVRILQAQTVDQMTHVQNPGAKNAKGQPDRRGLLWDIYYPDPDDKGVDALYAYGHTGYTGGAIRIYPEQGVYVLAMTNRVHPDDSGKVGAFRTAVWDTVGRIVMGVSDAPGAAPEPATTQPTTRPGDEADRLGRVYVPTTFQLHDGKVDLVVHFHGGFNIVRGAAEQARLSAAIVGVQRHGLSSVYEKPFSDPELFGQVIDNAVATLRADKRISPDATLGRLYVSSFSAGFGAVRAILQVPRYFEMIDGIIMADSLYAGYAAPIEQRQVDPADMKDFRRFAAEAAADRNLLILTHCDLQPDGYASTRETADDLIRSLGGQRREVPPSVGPGTMHLTSRFDRGGFHVRGYTGTEGRDHMDHLRNLWAWYTMLPVSTYDGAWEHPLDTGPPVE